MPSLPQPPSIDELVDRLLTVYEYVKTRIPGNLDFCIAGGPVRDTLLGIEPNDYDVWVLDVEQKRAQNIFDCFQLDKSLIPAPPKYSWIDDPLALGMAGGGLSDDDTATVARKWILPAWEWTPKLHVITTPQVTIDALIASFDWNICQMAYDGQQFFLPFGPKDIYPGASLVLMNVNEPFATLRRGFDFSKRFEMTLAAKDLEELIDKAYHQQYPGE